MEIYHHPLYKEDIEIVAGLALPWEKLKSSSVMISGATGLLGSFLIDVIMHKNLNEGLGCVIYALGRYKGKAMNRFGYCFHLPDFNFFTCDVNQPLALGEISQVDYVIHRQVIHIRWHMLLIRLGQL